MNKQRCFKYLIPIIGLCAMVFTSASVLAEDWTDKVLIYGFMTAAVQKIDQSAAVYNGDMLEGGLTDDTSTAGTRYGFNINAEVNDWVSVASQFFATRTEENYGAHIDFAIITVNLSDNLDLRAGRMKFPGGLLSEYVSVGHSYPWIEPPQEMYSKQAGASQAVHEAFSGVSFLAMHSSGDMAYSANLFFGEVVEETVNRKDFSGVTLEVNWDDKVTVQLAANSSTMRSDLVEMAMMDGEDHDITQFSLRVDWNDVIVYSEFADVDMGAFKFGEARTNYVMLGYRFDKLLPHITVANLEKSQNENSGMMMGDTLLRPYEQTTTTLGLRWDFMESISAKFEVSTIELDSIDVTVAGYGMFNTMPDEDSVTRYGIAIDAVF